jgi:hypothetical protein
MLLSILADVWENARHMQLFVVWTYVGGLPDVCSANSTQMYAGSHGRMLLFEISSS